MFLYPLGLLALLGVPAVLGLHLYRRRYRRRLVSSLLLWEPRDTTPAAGRKREPLRSSASLIAELLAALCLALAFAGLRGCGSGQVDHLVVVLDGSASMGAESSNGSAVQRARALVSARLDQLAADGRATLVRSGPRPEVLVGPAAFRDEAQEALANFRPGHIHHDLEPAVALAEQLRGSGPVLVVTDRFEPEQLPASVELQSIGEALPNLALVSASRSPGGPSLGEAGLDAPAGPEDELRLTVTCYGGGEVEGRLRAAWVDAAGASAQGEIPFRIAPGESQSLTLRVPRDAGIVHLQLPGDALDIDNHAYLAPEPRRNLRLATTLDEKVLASLGLSDGEPLGRWLSLLPDARQVAPEQAHLVLGSEPQATATRWSLAIPPPAEPSAIQSLVGPFLLDRSTPLLRGVTLDGIVWSTSGGGVPTGIPLGSAGNRPLLTEDPAGPGRSLLMDIQPGRSSLMRSPDWPILLTNLAEMRRAALPGPARHNLVLGEPLVFRDDEAARYLLRGPEGQVETQARGVLILDEPPAPGAYELLRGIGKAAPSEPVAQVAWSFVDSGESDLTNLRAGESAASSTSDGSRVRAAQSRVELGLVALALLFGLANWLFLSPKGKAS